MRADIEEMIKARSGDFLVMDGFDDAIIGILDRCGQLPVVAYDYEKCIDVLIGQGMTDEEAREYFEFNCVGAYVGEQTPVIVTQL